MTQPRHGSGARAGAPVGEPADGARPRSPAAGMVARNLTRPRALARKLVLGEALGERPVRGPMPGRPRRR